jgi:hypothetical protein
MCIYIYICIYIYDIYDIYMYIYIYIYVTVVQRGGLRYLALSIYIRVCRRQQEQRSPIYDSGVMKDEKVQVWGLHTSYTLG